VREGEDGAGARRVRRGAAAVLAELGRAGGSGGPEGRSGGKGRASGGRGWGRKAAWGGGLGVKIGGGGRL
jgi:hypothetical protein